MKWRYNLKLGKIEGKKDPFNITKNFGVENLGPYA